MTPSPTYHLACPVPVPRLRDAGTSMRQVPRRYAGSAEIVLCWDEQNRLQGVRDDGHLSFYLYDANGDRTCKFTGEYTVQNQTGRWQHFYQMGNATLYASPYLVITPQGYTKHYYAGAERICSKIGGGGLGNIDSLAVAQDDLESKHASLKYHVRDVAECLGSPDYGFDTVFSELYYWKAIRENQETDCYWYHPDHLGSSSWITYTDGSAVQHLHYLPWGEDFVDQRQNSFDGTRYTFSAKERDSETGLSYFGSRYYSSDLSIWLSVDPMSAKYPHQSNYVYCSNNPIKVVDPNGEDEWDLSRDGYLTKRKNGRTDVDVVYATDKNGKEISRYYKAGTINQNPNSYPGVLYEGKPEERRFTTDIMTFADADVAVDFFEFAAENTEVEWALNIGETTTIVGTSHQSDLNKVSYPPNLLSQTHSHWNDGQKLSFRGANGEPCPTCDIPMMIDNPYTYKVYEAFNHRYASMDDQRNLRNEISKNVQKSINLLKKTNHFWFR